MDKSEWTTGSAVGKREHNEDTWAVIDTRRGPEGTHLPIALVCDGMGGHSYGEIAAKCCAEGFLERFETPTEGEDVAARLRNAAAAGNSAIEARMIEEPKLYGMGTTLTAAAVTADGLAWVSIGDSPLLLWRAEAGSVECLNTLHNVPGQANQLTSAVMGDPLTEVDWPLHTVPLRAGDAVIVASDGIDTLSRDEIAAIAAADAAGGESRLAERLLEAVEAAGKPKQDNTTAVCLRVRANHASGARGHGVIEGRRGEAGSVVSVNGSVLDLDKSLSLRRHSPTGFEWGYAGSGPAQLALAILLEIAAEETALALYQVFKREWLTGIRNSEWRLRSAEVEKWLREGAGRIGAGA